MSINYREELIKEFAENDLEWKVQSSGIKNNKVWCKVVPYVTARAIQKRLDNIFGFENWSDTYRNTENGQICQLKVFLNDKWIIKENGAEFTEYEKLKGAISNSFKRVAASGYGIGRYLYDIKIKFAECSIEKKEGFTEFAKTEGKNFYWKIPSLDDGKNNNIVEFSKKIISPDQLKRLCTIATKAEIEDEKVKMWIDKKYNIKSKKELNQKQYQELIENLEKKINQAI